MTDDGDPKVYTCGDSGGENADGDPCGRPVAGPNARCQYHPFEDDDAEADDGGGGRGDWDGPDYTAANLEPEPHARQPKEFDAFERRAEILEFIRQRGDPRAINQTDLAKRYGVDQSTISRDVDELSAFITESVDETKLLAILETNFEAAIRDLQDRPMDRVRALDSWADFLFRSGRLEEEPDRLEVDAGLNVNTEIVEVGPASDDEE